MSTPAFQFPDTSELLSPALVIFKDRVEHNIRVMLDIAKGASRLRPHCKTHKMPEVTKLELAAGITKHKAATFGECEMLADAGVTDIFLSYNLVGPNIGRAVAFRKKYPHVLLCVTADDFDCLRQLSAAMAAAGQSIQVAVDLNMGLNRTGIEIGDPAFELYRQVVELPGVEPGGFHCYDGHLQHRDVAERKTAVSPVWEKIQALKGRLVAQGWPVPRIVAGGTGTFPVYAAYDDPLIELAAGTTIFHDTGYGDQFPDMPAFQHAALLLTRVISRPAPGWMTLDAGNKAVSPDQPFETRVRLLADPQAKVIRHNEEHLSLQSSVADNYKPGDVLWGVPRHICTTTYLYPWVYVSENGQVTGKWEVRARDRQITI
ncbi:MAG: D-TA family PLP-dependent enzyme [Planctomycetaceae bacterium]|nr:D-TA family PLP-dependent enzyme [Planctomycetaceae bacterium]